MYKTQILLKTALSVGVAILISNFTFATPPKPVSEMSKKELKFYKRDINELAYNTKVTKDKGSGITWVESPTEKDTSTSMLRHFFRSAIKDGKVVANYLFVMHTRPDDADYNRKKYDYTAFTLEGTPIVTKVADPTYDAQSGYVTQISTLILNDTLLRSNQESGMYLLAKNTFGETDVPIKPALIAAFVKRLDKELEKSK